MKEKLIDAFWVAFTIVGSIAGFGVFLLAIIACSSLVVALAGASSSGG